MKRIVFILLLATISFSTNGLLFEPYFVDGSAGLTAYSNAPYATGMFFTPLDAELPDLTTFSPDGSQNVATLSFGRYGATYPTICFSVEFVLNSTFSDCINTTVEPWYSEWETRQIATFQFPMSSYALTSGGNYNHARFYNINATDAVAVYLTNSITLGGAIAENRCTDNLANVYNATSRLVTINLNLWETLYKLVDFALWLVAIFLLVPFCLYMLLRSYHKIRDYLIEQHGGR